jgi:hypothetical protein
MAADATLVIECSLAAASRGLAARLADKAARIAEARTASLLRARRGDPSRWRRAVLLWPLFAKDR